MSGARRAQALLSQHGPFVSHPGHDLKSSSLALNVSPRVGIPGDQLHGFHWCHGGNPTGEHQTKVLRCWPMPLRLCTVSFQSPTGVRHGVDVEAETLDAEAYAKRTGRPIKTARPQCRGR